MKKFFATLVGQWEKMSGTTKFNQQEQIERELAEERKQQAKDRMQQHLRDEMKKREEPVNPASIPSDSEKA